LVLVKSVRPRLSALFDSLRGAIDADRQRMGRFVILGSSQASLVRQVAESLAGRVGTGALSATIDQGEGTDQTCWFSLSSTFDLGADCATVRFLVKQLLPYL
jgi:hypothetical protein